MIALSLATVTEFSPYFGFIRWIGGHCVLAAWQSNGSAGTSRFGRF